MFDLIECDGIFDLRKGSDELFFQLSELIGVGEKFEYCGREGARCNNILGQSLAESSCPVLPVVS